MVVLQFLRRHVVESFKVLLVSFLSTVLIISSPVVLAQSDGELIGASSRRLTTWKKSTMDKMSR